MTRAKKLTAVGLGTLAVAAIVTAGFFALAQPSSTVDLVEAPQGIDTPIGEKVSDKEMEEALKAAEETRAEMAGRDGALYVGDGEGGSNQEVAFGMDLLPAVVSGGVKDTTAEMIDVFAWNAGYMNTIAGGEARGVTAARDDCLAEFASTELAQAGGTWRVETTQACDREVAVLVGGPGSSNYSLLGASLNDEKIAALLLDWSSFDYGSAGTGDGQGFAFVAARSGS